jgi:hypothetical protein
MGIIDENGDQWEACNRCGRLAHINTLRYEPASEKHPCGRDLCKQCAPAGQKPHGPAVTIWLNSPE